MIVIVDLKISNIASVSLALKHMGYEHVVSDDADVIKTADKLILPGVGSFFVAMDRLRVLGLVDTLRQKVLENKVPILGICLGMQLFASYGDEGGGTEGLDLIRGKVSKMKVRDELRLPHIGWNDLSHNSFKIFDVLNDNLCFYFVHSYALSPEEEVETAVCNYGEDFVAAVKKDNIIGFQFHPEKSQKSGLALLKNFCEGNY